MTSFPPFGEDFFDEAGNPIVVWDYTNSRRVEFFPDGTTQFREFTPEELLLVPAKLAEEEARAAYETTRTAVKAIVVDLKFEKDRAQTVIDNVNSTSREKDLARSVKRIADACIDLAKLVKDM